MTFPVVIKKSNEQFTASLVGSSEVQTVGASRTQVLENLKAEITKRVGSGEILSLEIESTGISELSGRYRDDPTLREICSDAYRQRDEERAT